MKHCRGHRFFTGMLQGMGSGLVLGLVTLYLLSGQDAVPSLQAQASWIQTLTHWVYRNFGWSLLPFGITLALYLASLRQLDRRLAENSPQDEISQIEHLTDVWISLFFGIGVIWTAIGMRGALLHALGEPGIAAQTGAFTVLQRLVDGGILTALSTTILGGIGGYLMRVTKGLYLGARLNRYYGEQDQGQSARVEDLLRGIQQSIASDRVEQ
jgi:hypothetical protein